jgi:integrase
MQEKGEAEEDILEPKKAPALVGRFIAASTGTFSPQVLKTMLGHLKRVIQIFDHRSEHGLLGLLSRALGKDAPTPSRRYDTMWDISILLNWLRQHWGENAELADGELQTKAMLMVMVFSACRLAELARMDTPQDAEEGGTAMVLYTVTKQFQEARRRIVIRRIGDERVCPVRTVAAWIRRRGPSEDGRLFGRSRGGGEEARTQQWTTDGICTQFLTVMRAAGIPEHFTAYSVKHAVVTKLFKLGATEEQMNAYGGWAPGSRTARRWYDIATLEEDWLGTKLVGEWFGGDTEAALEDLLQEYLPVTTTSGDAEVRAPVMEALAAAAEEGTDGIEAPPEEAEEL